MCIYVTENFRNRVVSAFYYTCVREFLDSITYCEMHTKLLSLGWGVVLFQVHTSEDSNLVPRTNVTKNG